MNGAGVIGTTVDDLPRTDRFVFDKNPSEPKGGTFVEFRLTYQGRLPAASQTDLRAKEKHEIRKVLHPQLAELWRQHPGLRWQSEKQVTVIPRPEDHIPAITSVVTPSMVMSQAVPPTRSKTPVEIIADIYKRNGYRFVPLIHQRGGTMCSLDILFLRRDSPGGLIRSGGDIDNRIKVLFDALRMPNDAGELGGYDKPDPGEDPFFCLIGDETLITDVSITTDRVLVPVGPGESIHDVQLVILVKTKVIDRSGFLARGAPAKCSVGEVQ